MNVTQWFTADPARPGLYQIFNKDLINTKLKLYSYWDGTIWYQSGFCGDVALKMYFWKKSGFLKKKVWRGLVEKPDYWV